MAAAFVHRKLRKAVSDHAGLCGAFTLIDAMRAFGDLLLRTLENES
jgi:hypothetical protein